MNKAYTNIRPTLTLSALPAYGASFYGSGIAPFSRLSVKDVPAGRQNVTVSGECVTESGETLYRLPEKTFESLDTAWFDPKNSGELTLSFEKGDFLVDEQKLMTRENAENALLTVSLTVAEETVTVSENVRILAGNEWAGIETHPETLAYFCFPQDERTAALAEKVPVSSYYPTDVRRTVKSLVDTIRKAGIVCANRDSYSPERRQSLRRPDVYLGRSSVIASTLELGMLYCSCAARCGLDTAMLFVRNQKTVNVYAGVWTIRKSGFPDVSESLSGVRKALRCGQLILLDPASLSAAQNTETELVCREASLAVQKTSAEMLLLISFAGKTVIREKTGGARTILSGIYEGLVDRPVFALLDGRYEAFDCLPLMTADFEKTLADIKTGTRLVPLAVSDKPEVFAGLVDHMGSFSQFGIGGIAERSYNKAEEEQAKNQLADFCARLAMRAGCTVGLYESAFHERASRMTFSGGDEKNYVIAGFVRVRETPDDRYRYLPLCFLPAEMAYEQPYTVTLAERMPLLNTCLFAALSGQTSSIPVCRNVREALSAGGRLVKENAGRFAEIALIRELAVVRADLADFILWEDLRTGARAMLENKAFTDVLTGKKPQKEPGQTSVDAGRELFIKPLTKNEKTALTTEENVILTGHADREKASLTAAGAAYRLMKGESAVVVSENEEFLRSCRETLEKAGLSEWVLDLTKEHETADIVADMREKARRCAGKTTGGWLCVSAEYSALCRTLDEYASRLTEPDALFGVSVKDACETYCAASLGTDEKEILPVAEDVFRNMTAEKYEGLFRAAETMIGTAREAAHSVGKPTGVPLKEHPLAMLDLPSALDDGAKEQVRSYIDGILPVFAEYRGTLFEIGKELGIEVQDVKTLKELESLNDLYRLMITAREITIPERFGEWDIAAFAEDASTAAQVKDRMDAIEYQLRFFNKELFDDVDTLLSDYDYSDVRRGSFLKKYLFRRNSKDVLMPYVSGENRAEFARHDLETIYKLLAEYRLLRYEAARKEDPKTDTGTDENTLKLAELSSSVAGILRDIFPDKKDDAAWLNGKMASVFSFIIHMNETPDVSRKLTYARAKLEEVCAENGGMLRKLAKLLGTDFAALSFDEGIVSFDGLSGCLKGIDENLEQSGAWMAFRNSAKGADGTLASFWNCLYENGMTETTDRLFAKSLILPTVRYLSGKKQLESGAEKAHKVLNAFFEETDKHLAKASEACTNACERRLARFLENRKAKRPEEDEALPMAEFAEKYIEDLIAYYPCVLVPSDGLVRLTKGRVLFDRAFVTDASAGKYDAVTRLTAAGRVTLADFSGGTSGLYKLLAAAGAVRHAVSYHEGGTQGGLVSFASREKALSAAFGGKLSYVTVNGVMRRVGDMANADEANVCVSMTEELLKNGAQRVGLFAFSGGQCAYIRHLLYLTAEKEKEPILQTALAEGRITVKDARLPNFDTFDAVLASVGAGVDKDGHIGWNFFGKEPLAASLMHIASATEGGVTFVLSLGEKQLEQLCGSGRDAKALSAFAAYLIHGVMPLRYAETYFAESAVRNAFLDRENGAYRPAVGLYACGADAVKTDGTEIMLWECTDGTPYTDKLMAGRLFAGRGVSVRTVSPLTLVTENADL